MGQYKMSVYFIFTLHHYAKTKLLLPFQWKLFGKMCTIFKWLKVLIEPNISIKAILFLFLFL